MLTQESMCELCAAIDENYVDWMILEPESRALKKKDKIWAQVDKMQNERIHFKVFPRSFHRIQKLHKNELFNIHFQLNRTSFQMQHNALDYVKKHKLFDILINNPKCADRIENLSTDSNKEESADEM